MKHCNAPENQTTRRILPIACATALAVAFMVSLPQPAHADHVTATRARQHSGASGEQGVHLGSRPRHPRLHLPALRLWLRLDILRAAGHLVQRR